VTPRTLAPALALLLGLPAAAPAGQPQPPPQRPDAAALDRRLAELEAGLARMTKEVQALRGDLKRLAPAPPESEYRVYTLKNADGTKLAKTLQELLGDRDLRVVCDPQTNSLLVRGDRETMAVLEALITRLDDARPTPGDKKGEKADEKPRGGQPNR
jgi:hypothetical protein